MIVSGGSAGAGRRGHTPDAAYDLDRLRKTGPGRLDETNVATVDRLLDPHEGAGVLKRADVYYRARCASYVIAHLTLASIAVASGIDYSSPLR
ncbi:hypothetical protein CVN56_31110 [Rhodococcus sp. AQ5-07]|nr:hypothetical protein CVN56_31110 [Rhodococcus sp. AQ5-07]